MVEAALPIWEGLTWREGCAALRVTQVLSGHGCIGEYLHGIRKELTIVFHYCRENRDTVQHALKHCPACETLRRVLVTSITGDLSLVAVLRALRIEQDRDPSPSSAIKYCFAKRRSGRGRRQAPGVGGGLDLAGIEFDIKYGMLTCLRLPTARFGDLNTLRDSKSCCCGVVWSYSEATMRVAEPLHTCLR